MAATRAAEERATGRAYAAFISYSRTADGGLAPRLETALERFATPWYRLRGLEVFRDDSDLSSNPGLWSSLTGALDGAEHLVLLASPAAAASHWVGRELEYWLAHRGPDRVLIVLTEGEIAWDEGAGDFDWERTTALPPVLTGAFAEEPRYTDLRFAPDADSLSLRDPRFRDAVADVAAPLWGRPKDDLIGDEVREHRRMLRIARAAGAALALLAVAASVAAILAIRAADRANRERDRAEQQTRVATSRQLAAQSAVALRDGELGDALGQAARGWKTARTGESRDALLAALQDARGVETVLHGPQTKVAAVSGDRTRVALLGADDRVTVLDLGTRRPVGAPLRLRRADTPAESDLFAVPAGLALDAHGDRLAVGYDTGSLDLWDVAARKARWVVDRGREGPTDGGALPVFSADGKRLAWGSGAMAISVWDGARIRTLRAPEPIGFASWSVALSSDGRFLAAAGASSGDIALWRVGRPPRVLHGPPPGLGAVPVALGAGARPVLAAGGADGRVQMWDAASGRRLRTLRVRRGPVRGLAFSPDGRRLAVVDPGAVTLFTAGGARVGATTALTATRGATPADASGRVVTVGAGGVVVVRRPGARAGQIALPLAGASEDAPPVFDPSGRRIAGLDAHSRLRLWNPSDGRTVGAPLGPAFESLVLRALPDGRLLTCCGFDRGAAIRIWDPSGGGARVVPGRGEPTDATAGPGGRVVVARVVGGKVVVTGNGSALKIPSGGYIGRLSPDGRWLAVATDEGIDVWSLATRRRTASLRGDFGIAFSPVGPLVAVAAGPEPIRLIDRRTGRVRGTLPNDFEVAGMEFGPDGRTLATVTKHTGAGGADVAALELWDVGARRRIGEEPLVERTAPVDVTEIAFAPDGRRLVVNGLGTPLVVDLDVDDWAARASRLAAGPR